MILLEGGGHGYDTPGKRSPDGAIREYKYTRLISKMIFQQLRDKGYECEIIVTEDNDVPLKERVRRVNSYCNKYGTSNVVFISVHINAAGNGLLWLNARGFSVYTSKGKTKSDILANLLYEEAAKNFKNQKIRKDYSDGDVDWEENFYILKNTKCPAVLSENFFMDNKEDVEYLLSEEGMKAIVKTHVDAIIKYVNEYLK